MNLDFTNHAILKGAADAIRMHNYIHNRAERNAVLITEYLNFAANLIDKFANGDVVAVKHGQWLNAVIDGSDFCRCSECGCYIEAAFFANDYNVNYCPNCGAKIDREVDNG